MTQSSARFFMDLCLLELSARDQCFRARGRPKTCNLIAGADSPNAFEWRRLDGGPLPNDGLFDRHRTIVIETAHEG